MIEQLNKSEKNILAIEVIDGFTETDAKLCRKYFNEKLKQGFDQVNILVKLDELKMSNSSIKAFMEDSIFGLRNYRKLGHMAIVAHSHIIKALVPIDNLFFQRAKRGRQERYFDASQMDEAMAFVSETAEE
ncbi:MAG TPA: STAS/SEC14 domain-containing protein [Cryomorphaceae bacterium]|nr:STAS/SEC14 domain-containing protein [Cryomorphaceae bacterium]